MNSNLINVGFRGIIITLTIIAVLCITIFSFHIIDKTISENNFERQQTELESFCNSKHFKDFIVLFKKSYDNSSEEINFFIKRTEDQYPEWKNFKIIILISGNYYYLEKYNRFSANNYLASVKMSEEENILVDILMKPQREKKALLLDRLKKEKHFTHVAGQPEAFMIVTIDKR